MKKLFWSGVIGLILFEIVNVYFIMPMPGSQQMNSIGLAYFLYSWRWVFRGVFGIMIVAGLFRLWPAYRWKWLLLIPLFIAAAVTYVANFKMAADAMFRQPRQVLGVRKEQNKVQADRLVLGVFINGEAKAYPVQFLGYHHHVQDTVGGKYIMITYCTVCRSGRVFEPMVNGKRETFRLVGMDHFNAMLEDAGTKSWWRQASGEAIAGKLKGQVLPEVYCAQTSLAKWMELHPDTWIIQPDSASLKWYDSTMKYEGGKSRSRLTGTDSLSWKDKSWVIGVRVGNKSKAFDWNQLKSERMLEDEISGTPVLLVLSRDEKSFFAFRRPEGHAEFSLQGDTIRMDHHLFRIDGRGIDTMMTLQALPAYQEFWHSWRTFNPGTGKADEKSR